MPRGTSGVRTIPRASDGSYSLPAGSLVNVGEDIVPSQHNPPLTDLSQAITGSLSRDGLGAMRAAFNGGGFRATNLAAGVQPNDAVIMSQLASGAGGLPAGSVVDFAGSAIPTGWLICAGQALSRADYPDLFAAIGTAYGAPSGSTFNIPDTRGRVTAGRDVDSGGFAGRLTTPNSQTLGAAGGTQTVTLTTAEMPSHTHTVSGSTNSDGAHVHGNSRSDAPGGTGDGTHIVTNSVPSGTTIFTGSSGTHSHTLSGIADATGGGGAHQNVQPTIVMTKIIKTSNS